MIGSADYFVLKILEAGEKRGLLWNLIDTPGPSNHSPP